MSDPLPRPTLGDVAGRVLTADRSTRSTLIEQLAERARTADQLLAISDGFLEAGPRGERAFLQWVAQVRIPLPDLIRARILPRLASRQIPVPTRVLAAARVLKGLPDKPESVMAVVRPLTAGLSPLRRLERLRQLQHKIDVCRSLDAFIERREQRLKIDCPRCGQRFIREIMIRHLWHEHGLLLERGKVRRAKPSLAELQAAFADGHDTTVLDRASLTATPRELRRWAAPDATADEFRLLNSEAAEHGTVVCPACLSERAPVVPPMPPPLSLAHGRLAGDGNVVQISGADWLRIVSVTVPGRTIKYAPDGPNSLGVRGIASLLAAFLLLIAFCMVVFGNRAWSSPPVIARLLLTAGLGYGLTWFVRLTQPKPNDRAVDAAWTVLVPQLMKGNHSQRWLARLCRTSAGFGDPNLRAGILRDVIAFASHGGTVADLQLLAAAGLLEAEDGATMGKDRAAMIASHIAAGLTGEQPIAFAEFAADCYANGARQPDAGEAARVRVMLLDAAFEAGFLPRDLVELWSAAPQLRRVMGVEPLHRIALLHGVWAMRASRRWERVARADSVFDLAKLAPNISGRLLTDFPDLLLFHRPDPDTEAQIGPILVCTRGVVVGGRLLADPDTGVFLEKPGTSGAIDLVYGSHRFGLERTPHGDLAGMITEWLRFRAWALLPLLDKYLDRGGASVADRVKPLRRPCPHCRSVDR
jgi:uncharacterized C2H2 Zn-finger protein